MVSKPVRIEAAKVGSINTASLLVSIGISSKPWTRCEPVRSPSLKELCGGHKGLRWRQKNIPHLRRDQNLGLRGAESAPCYMLNMTLPTHVPLVLLEALCQSQWSAHIPQVCCTYRINEKTTILKAWSSSLCENKLQGQIFESLRRRVSRARTFTSLCKLAFTPNLSIFAG